MSIELETQIALQQSNILSDTDTWITLCAAIATAYLTFIIRSYSKRLCKVEEDMELVKRDISKTNGKIEAHKSEHIGFEKGHKK
jgi:hypothetical protein